MLLYLKLKVDTSLTASAVYSHRGALAYDGVNSMVRCQTPDKCSDLVITSFVNPIVHFKLRNCNGIVTE